MTPIMSSLEKKKKRKIFQAVKGMRDILPKDQFYWEKIHQTTGNLAKAYGFERLDTPILEEAGLFVKGTGADTDIVEKEMYSFQTKGGEQVALRPEFTPAVMRAYLENGLSSLPHPVKLFSIGPLFRYDRPQKGRYRQLHQANFEVIGEKDSVADAQLIQIFFALLKELGIKENITAQINSIGCSKCRPDYRRILISYYRNRIKELCPDCQSRLRKNPLRLLDCKEARCVKIAEEAPEIIDYLCVECHNHLKSVLEYLDELSIPYILNPRLVRGLDYYTKTVFEFWPEEKESRQISLGGGGRYDDLIKQLGGKATPAVGMAAGIDRLVDMMKEKAVKIPVKNRPLIFLVQLGHLGKRKCLCLFEDLRKAGLDSASAFSKNTIKSQLETADKLGANFSLLVGQKEALDGTVIIRDMDSGNQDSVLMEKVIKELKKRLKK